MKRKITFLVVAVLCLQTLLAQNKTIRGTIVDSFSEPIIGASAHVKGTYTGTISDLNGNYTLENVPEDAVITFSYIGMIPQEIAVKGKNVINVQLKDDVQKLVAPCPPRRPLRGGGQTAQDDACRRVPQDGGRTVHEGL